MALQSQLSASVEEEPRHRNQNEAEEGKDAPSPVDPNPRRIQLDDELRKSGSKEEPQQSVGCNGGCRVGAAVDVYNVRYGCEESRQRTPAYRETSERRYYPVNSVTRRPRIPL